MAVALLPALFLTGLSFMWLGLAKGQWLPRWPTEDALNKDMPPIRWHNVTHWFVNFMVECVRADPQWWAKFLCFCICAEAFGLLFYSFSNGMTVAVSPL